MAEAEAAGGRQPGEGGAEGGFTASSPLLRFILQLTAQQLVDKADVEVAEALSLPPSLLDSLKGWGGSGEAHILASRRAGSYCLTAKAVSFVA